MKLFGANNNRQKSKPPEPEFFDELPSRKKQVGDFLKDQIQKRRTLWIVGGLLFMILTSTLVQSGSKEKDNDTPPVQDERRQMMSRKSMENMIQASSESKTTSTVPQIEDQRYRSHKRKLDSQIGVFLFEEEDEKKRVKRRTEKRDEISLGLPSGVKIPALLEDKVFSFNVAAPVIALVPRDFTWKDQIVIPEGSKFLGEANVLKSLDRINVRFDLLILPDDTEIRLRAIALSGDGANGILGKVSKHTDTKILKAIGETALAGASLFVGGGRRDPFSLEDQVRLNLAKNLTDEASRDLRRVQTDKSVTVEAYTPIQVLLLESI